MRILGKTKKRIDRDVIEILTAELISITIGLIGGYLLARSTNQLALLPGFLIMIPGFLEMQGNILGSLAGRIGTALELKTISKYLHWNTFIKDNLFASLIIGCITALTLGVIAFLTTWLFFGQYSPSIILLTLIALIISLAIELPLTIIMTYWFYNHGYEPDDIMGPYVTTWADIISIAALLLAFWVIL
ncbi:MAG: magnesium transporter [Nanoarchaeota archaeon]|nr:magnesium transporter [Nanoarchaeota archaeon]